MASCERILLDADLEGLNQKERKSLIKSLDEFIAKRNKRPPKGFHTLNEDTKDLIKKLRDETRLKAEIRLNDALNNIIIHEQIMNRILSEGETNPIRRLLGFLEGEHGQRFSVDYQGKSNGGRMLTYFLNDLERSDLLEAFRDGTIEREIFQDLHELYKKHHAGLDVDMPKSVEDKNFKFSGNEQAREIAEIIFHYDKLSVDRLNLSNARVTLSPHRLINKAPDFMKIRALGKTQEEAFVAWKKLANKHFDLEAMLDLVPPEKHDDYLREIFHDYYNGINIKSHAGGDINFKFMNTTNLGRTVSTKNRIIYLDGSHSYEYLQEVGHKGYNIQAAVAFGLEHDGRNHALLENLGTNPEAMLMGVINEVKTRFKDRYKDLDKESDDLLRETGKNGIPQKILDSLEILNGNTRNPVNVNRAVIGASIRAIKNMSLLGFATVRSLNDIVTASFTAKKDGIPWATIMHELPMNFIKNFESPWLNIKADPAKRRIAALIGLGPRALVSDIVGKFGADDALPGFINKLQRNYFKANLLTYWNDAMKTSYSMMLSHHLGLEANKQTPMEEVQRLLRSFDISEDEWQLIRRTAKWEAEDGRWYLSPDRLDDTSRLTDDDLDALIRMEQGAVTEKRFGEATAEFNKRQVKLKEDIEELKEEIQKEKLKLSNEKITDEDRIKTNKRIKELGDIDKLKEEELKKTAPTLKEVSDSIQKYSDFLNEMELYNLDLRNKLVKHYRNKETAELMAVRFLSGMEGNKRDEFAREFQKYWDPAKKEWRARELQEHLDFMLKAKGEAQTPEADKIVDWKRFYSETDDSQMEFDFNKEEVKEAWGKFLTVMSEHQPHIDFIHRRIQRAWHEEADHLFKWTKRKTGIPEQDTIKPEWDPPALFKHGILSQKEEKAIWDKAAGLDEKLKVLRKNVSSEYAHFVFGGEDVKGISQADRDKKRHQLSSKLTTLFYDRNDHAVLIPGAREKRLMTQGQRAGSYIGEAVRFIGQFKTFPVTLMTKSIAQEMNGKNWTGPNRMDFLGSEHVQIAKFIAGMTAMGAVTTAATDFLKGKTIRDTFDPTSDEFLDFTTEIGRNNLVDAFVYGGGAGFYGDILAAPYGSHKHFSMVQNMLGPTISQLDDIKDVTWGILNGDKKAKKAYNLILQNTPYANIFYYKQALDYMILYQMQDIIDPGYHRRRRRQMHKDQGQDYRFGSRGFFQ